MSFLGVQLIGALGYSILSFSYFKKEKLQILFLQMISYVFFTIHYYLLSGITGAMCNLLGLIALLFIYIFEKYNIGNKKILLFIIIPLLFVITFITYDNIFSIFPMISSIVVILSFFTTNEDIIRFIGIIAAICWLIYAIVYHSFVAVAFEVITLLSVTVAFFKNYFKIVKKR